MLQKIDKRIFTTLFFSLFASVTGVGIVVPLLPVYAHDLGAGGLYIGFIFGAFSLSRTVFIPYFGRISDKKGRKPYIVAGLLGYALISIAFIFSKSVNSLIAIRFLQGIASAMLMPVVQAYVGDITRVGREGITMGMFNISVFLGLSAGPLIGGIVNDRFNLNTAFIAMGFFAFFGFLLSLFMLPPKKSERVKCKSWQPVEWTLILKDRMILGLIIFRFAYTTCIGVIWGFMPVFVDTEFGLSSSLIGVLVMLGVFTSGVLQVPAGFIADRVNKRNMVAAGGLITGAAIFYFAFAGDFSQLFVANLVFGIGGGISTPALMAIAVLKGRATDSMGSVMGLMTFAHSFGMLAGSIFAGFMMDMMILRQAFSYGALIMVSGTFLFLFVSVNRVRDNT